MTEIRRSKSSLLTIPIGFSALFIAWCLHELGIVRVNGFSEPIFRAWALLFLFPVIGYFVLLWPRRNLPILILSEKCIIFRSGIFLQKSVSLPISAVIDVFTNWQGPNSESWCDLIFVVKSDVRELLEHARVLRLKDDGWHFEFSTADRSAFETVHVIKNEIKGLTEGG